MKQSRRKNVKICEKSKKLEVSQSLEIYRFNFAIRKTYILIN
jgi:hypothetical protein